MKNRIGGRLGGLASDAGLLFVACSVGAAVLASPASGQVVNEDFKLLASDGAAGDKFGHSVSVSGDVAVIGAWYDDDNGNDSGSAYVYRFDGSSWTQEAKLLASDGAEHAHFGNSVSISGDVAVIGARDDDGNGIGSGSAYVFRKNGSGWTQEAKLLGNVALPGHKLHFGQSVSISGNVVMIGANGDHGNEELTGSAYVFRFNGSGWTQEAKLLASDGEFNDQFGHSVSVSGDVAVIGAFFDNDNGNLSGSAYVFRENGSGWMQEVKLLASDGAASDRFGYSVSVFFDDVAVIGADGDDDNGSSSGSVYVFRENGSGWTQEAKPLASDGAASDSFGSSVSISGDVAVIGAPGDDDNGSSSGSAYRFLFDGSSWAEENKLLASDGTAPSLSGASISVSGDVTMVGAPGSTNKGAVYAFGVQPDTDTDSDGLLDDWELSGIPYTDSFGVEQRYILPGADPNKKDLYIEVDAMTGFSFSAAAQFMVQDAFGNAPVTNPDGTTGITLHILADQTDLPHVAVWQTSGSWPVDFDSYREVSFGTLLEQTDPDSAALLEAKAKAYRYCIVADKAGPDAFGGSAETPGDNSVLCFGGAAGTDIDFQASTFMHELGHNLGLLHGGGDDINGKPNYPSIMNYVLADKMSWNEDFWLLDYSRVGPEGFNTLDESSLDENAGIGTSGDLYDDFYMPFGINVLDMGNTVRKVQHAPLNGFPVNFGDAAGTGFQDFLITSGVVQDLNYAVDPPSGISLPSTPSAGDVLEPYNDWANIMLKTAAAIGPAAPVPAYPTDELTEEAIDWIDQNFPDPPSACVADVNGDGMVTPTDFTAWINAFNNNLPECDQNGDGACTPTDFTAWIANFNTGC